MNVNGTKAHVREERFGIVSLCMDSAMPKDAFLFMQSENTVVAEEKCFEEKDVIPINLVKGYKAITFDAEITLNAVGFFSTVLTSLAKNNVPLMCYSSYYTDHILVKEEKLEDAKKALRELGVVI